MRRARTLGFTREGPLPDLLRALEERGGVHALVLALPEGVAGAYISRPDCPLLFVNGHQAIARQRFTLAHEFGHHRMSHGTTVDEQAAISGYDRDPNEVCANAFAAEFLMPRAAVKRLFDGRRSLPVGLDSVVRIAVAFGLSAQMVRIKLKTCRRARRSGAHRAHLRRGDRGRPASGAATPARSEPLDDGLSRAGRRHRACRSRCAAARCGLYLTGEIDLDALAARTAAARARWPGCTATSRLTATAAAPSG